MAKIVPHQYQLEAVKSVFNHFEKNTTNPLIAMGTGTGKSVVIAEFLRQAFSAYPYQKVLVLTHVAKLIEQNHAKLLQIWENAPAGIYSAGLNKKQHTYPITFAGIMSIKKKPTIFGKIDLIMVDEAHLISDSESTVYRKVINELLELNPYLKVIGFSATCWREGIGHLTNGGLFQDVCFDITDRNSFMRLIAEGYLCPLIPKKPGTMLDVTGVHVQNGDFKLDELQLAVDKFETTSQILKEYLEIAYDRKKWLLFCSGIEHSTHVAEILTSLGVPCEALHSKLPKEKISDIIARFDSGELRALANNNMLTTGYDNPGIDFIGMLRPSKSSKLWVQMLGRGVRCYYVGGYDLSTFEGRCLAIREGGKLNCLVADNAGNTKRLGPINDPVIPSKKSDKKKDTPAPVRLCIACNCYNHISARFCEWCGAEFPATNNLKVTVSTENLIAGELPEIIEVEVDRITYQKHESKDKPAMLKATYYCGYHSYSEYVCFDHPPGYALNKAQLWLRARRKVKELPVILNVDKTTTIVLGVATHLAQPTHLRVWVNKKYPEVMATCFDGTCFGKIESDPFKIPTVKNEHCNIDEDEFPF